MAKFFLSLPVVSLFLALFLHSGGICRLINAQAPGQGAWCVAKPSTSDEALMNNIRYACRYVDCRIIEQGGRCFYPTSLLSHASVVMNLYYQQAGRNYYNCDFTNSGVIIVKDPSFGDCKYRFAK